MRKKQNFQTVVWKICFMFQDMGENKDYKVVKRIPVDGTINKGGKNVIFFL